jgi:hypothetical protein
MKEQSWLRILLPVILLAFGAVSVLFRGDNAETRARRAMARQFMGQLGVSYKTPTLSKGERLPASLGHLDGYLLVATKCAPCTASHAASTLAGNGIRPRELTVLVGDGSQDWRIPHGFEKSRIVVDGGAWNALAGSESGSPCVARVENATVQEVLP